MKGKVYKSTGSWYQVKGEDGQMYPARIRGIFKIEGLTTTNPISVGDEVTLLVEEDAERTATITSIADRNNYIARSSPHNKRQHHIVASNLDQTLLFATLKNPRTSNGFIDRFLLSAEAFHIPAILVFNKADLYGPKEQALYRHIEEVYTACGYQVMLCSVKDQLHLSEVKTLLSGKITLLSGHSGVGKSSFINALFPEMNLRVASVSDWSGKGMHTTTFAEMFDLPGGGQVIDTPGIRELGIVQIEKPELAQYFPEMRRLMSGCQFNNCMHINEPGCAVKEGVNSGEVSEMRYISYLSILDTMEDKKY